MDVKEDLKCLSLCMDDIGDKVLLLQSTVKLVMNQQVFKTRIH